MKERRITDEEIEILKGMFKDNDKLLKVIRKIFLPEVTPDAPLGENIDLWMTTPIKDMSPEQALINITARNHLITHVEQSLMQLKILANTDAKTLDEVKENIKKNSNR